MTVQGDQGGHMAEQGEQGGISRRSLLTKGAVAGGVVWVAPLVMSAPAGAAPVSGDPGGGCLTTASGLIKFGFGDGWEIGTNPDDQCGISDCAVSGDQTALLNALIAANPGLTASTPAPDEGGFPAGLSCGSGGVKIYVPEVLVGTPCTISAVRVKGANNTACGDSDESLTLDPSNGKYYVCAPPPGRGYSHINICLSCCVELDPGTT
jgi:hypothetical protein